MEATQSPTSNKAVKRKFLEITSAEEADTPLGKHCVLAADQTQDQLVLTGAPPAQNTLDTLPTELLCLVFGFQIISYNQKKRLSLVCKRFFAILRPVLFRTLALGTDKQGKGHQWMEYLVKDGQHLLGDITQAVLHNFNLSHCSPLLLNACKTRALRQQSHLPVSNTHPLKRCRSDREGVVLGADDPLFPIDPSQAFGVLARMPQLKKLTVDGFEDAIDGYDYSLPHRREVATPIAMGPSWPVLSTVRILTLNPDFGSWMFSDELLALTIKCCPSVKTLRINIRDFPWGPDPVFWDRLPLALGEASRLPQLAELELFRFGYFAEFEEGFPRGEGALYKCMAGWSPVDIEKCHQYFPAIRRLKVYGNLDINFPFEQEWDVDEVGVGGPYKIRHFAPKLKAFERLEHLVMTDEVMMFSDTFRDWIMNELGGGRKWARHCEWLYTHPSRMDTQRLKSARAIFSACRANLTSVSFVCKQKGTEFNRRWDNTGEPVMVRKFRNELFTYLTNPMSRGEDDSPIRVLE